MENIYKPEYYNEFVCIADKCPDTCCAGWEISVDRQSINYYLSKNDFISEKIKHNTVTDEDGDVIFKLNNGRCPFLTTENLCEIYIKYGGTGLCEICREHPRFTEIYDDFTEISLSISCPEANRIIFNSQLTENTYPSPESDTDDELLSDLIKSRTYLLNLIPSCEFTDFIKQLKDICRDLTENYGYYNTVNYSVFYEGDTEILTGIENILLNKSEILTDKWKKILSLSVKNTSDNKDKFINLYKNDIQKFTAYFTYRYFLKAINDCDIELTGAFIAMSVNLCIDIAIKTNTDFCETVRLFSKEIEHNTDNSDLLKQFITDNGEELL